MISNEKLHNINKENVQEAAKCIDVNELPRLVGLLSEKDDKVRYPALLLLKSRSEVRNDVYPYWDIFKGKLKSENSYQRSIGMMLIAENARWDIENKLDETLNDYFSLFHDDKPITVRQSIQALASIIPYKSHFLARIAEELISLNLNEIKQTMQKLVLIDILNILCLIRKQLKSDEIERYIFHALCGGLLDKKSKAGFDAML